MAQEAASQMRTSGSPGSPRAPEPTKGSGNDLQPTITEMRSPESPAEKENPTTTTLDGALTDLLLGAFLPCIPVILVTTLLLTLILYHRVNLDPGWLMLQTTATMNMSEPGILNRTLHLKNTGGTDAYYVRMNPAVLAVIATWTSKIIPYLTSTSMAIIAFFAGRRILDATKASKTQQLLTPHQTSILVNLLSGTGFKSLRDTVVYKFQGHGRLAQPVKLAAAALTWIITISFLIAAADTWFATATKPLNVEILSRHPSPINSYSRHFNPAMCNENDIFFDRPCPSDISTSCSYPCSIEGWNFTSGGTTTSKEGIKGAQQAAETLLGNSPLNHVQNISLGFGGSNYDSVYAAQQYYFLADVQLDTALDFIANTTSVSTSCQMVTPECQLDATGEGFSCPGGYSSPSFTYTGAVGVDPQMAMSSGNMSMVGIQFFDDSALTQPTGYGANSSSLFTSQNQLHFLTWSKGFPPEDTTTDTFQSMRSGNFLQTDSSGDTVFILNCSTQIFQTMYAWVNGSVLQDPSSQNQQQSFYPTPAPPGYGAIFSAPFAIDSALGHLSLQNAASLAAYRTDPHELSAKFADEFSKATIALTAGIMQPQKSILEQSRNNTELLARVPKVPLYFLVSLNALYAVVSVFIACLAAFVTGPAQAQEVKARLTVNGLASGLFEPLRNQETPVKTIEELYSEHRAKGEKWKGQEDGEIHKVGIRQTKKGGWVWWRSWESSV